MKILPAREEDLKDILELFDAGRMRMRASGNTVQWRGGYPGEALLREDIRKNQLFKVVRDGSIAGAFVLTHGPEPDYEKIRGKWLNEEEYCVIHRIVSAGGGVAPVIFDWALEQCPNLRIDTHQDNHAMLRVLEREGFHYVGDITIYDGTPRMGFHKIKPVTEKA